MKPTNLPNIRSYLALQGINPAKEYRGYGMYFAPWRAAEHSPCMKVDDTKQLWVDFGAENMGGSIVDLVMALHNCSCHEALKELKQPSSFSFHRNNENSPTQSTMQILSIKPLEERRLIAYLQSRSIHIELAQMYCQEIHYTMNGKPFFAIGFPSDGGGYELRNQFFKGGLPPKNTSTFDIGSTHCLLFEGFMNMLSYLTIKKTIQPKANMVVLNSVNNIARAMPFLRSHDTIHCMLDNDQAGRRALEQIAQLGTTVIDHSPAYQPFKDLNDYLCNKTQQTQTTRTK